MLRTAFTLPCRVLSSAPAVRRAVLTLVFAAGIVLFGWALSGQAQASESTPDSVVRPTDLVGLVDGTSAGSTPSVVSTTPVVGVPAQAAPVSSAGVLPQTLIGQDSFAIPTPTGDADVAPTVLTDEVARVADEFHDRGEAVVRPIAERVSGELPRTLPGKTSTGRTPAASDAGAGGPAVSAPSATTDKPSYDLAAPPTSAHSGPSAGPVEPDSDSLRRAAVRASDDHRVAVRIASSGGTSHQQSPAHQSASPDDAVVGSSHRSGDTGGVSLSATPAVTAHLVPVQGVGAAVAELIDRPEEVLVSPA